MCGSHSCSALHATRLQFSPPHSLTVTNSGGPALGQRASRAEAEAAAAAAVPLSTRAVAAPCRPACGERTAPRLRLRLCAAREEELLTSTLSHRRNGAAVGFPRRGRGGRERKAVKRVEREEGRRTTTKLTSHPSPRSLSLDYTVRKRSGGRVEAKHAQQRCQLQRRRAHRGFTSHSS